MDPGAPFEARFPILIPAGAMHSFKAAHNEIVWRLVVRGDVPLWPNFKTRLKLVVAPAGPENPR
jgi:hypothetical protein